ncbi:MAG: presqualene diphosphate synthase HpnD [Zoogloeaceae bacterium]|jgi:phytoene synthase|nr:presqualene diphosphate synthase HpnD [Zoogloeaceae bacterium]
MTPDAYCQQKAAASGSSFYASFRFLPPEKRNALTALYAFCREVDDVVDETRDSTLAAIKLEWWRQEVERIGAGKPQHPVGQALAAAAAHFHLPPAQLQEIIDGMAMDLAQTRYLDFAELSLYCYRVASVVGLLAAEIFGYSDARTLEYAKDLGMAFQLTNILRDVGEDLRRGRLYLPQEDLERFQVSPEDLLQGRTPENFVALMRYEAKRAQDYYRRAFARLPAADRKAQRPGLVMAAIYRTLLAEIEAADFQVLHQRIQLPPARKLWLAWKTWLFPGWLAKNRA